MAKPDRKFKALIVDPRETVRVYTPIGPLDFTRSDRHGMVETNDVVNKALFSTPRKAYLMSLYGEDPEFRDEIVKAHRDAVRSRRIITSE